MGLAPATRNLLETIYQFATPVLLGILCYVLYKQGKQIEAVLILIIGWTAIFYYWVKYFKLPSLDSMSKWPPFVSTCPDYLTLVSPLKTGDTKAVCMDFIGISKKPLAMAKTNPDNIPKVTEMTYPLHVFIPTSTSTTDGDAAVANITTCTEVKARGLTWAHVCD